MGTVRALERRHLSPLLSRMTSAPPRPANLLYPVVALTGILSATRQLYTHRGWGGHSEPDASGNIVLISVKSSPLPAAPVPTACSLIFCLPSATLPPSLFEYVSPGIDGDRECPRGKRGNDPESLRERDCSPPACRKRGPNFRNPAGLSGAAPLRSQAMGSPVRENHKKSFHHKTRAILPPR